jgi:hypothetical protein
METKIIRLSKDNIDKLIQNGRIVADIIEVDCGGREVEVEIILVFKKD